jgi:nicotinamidase/pyrazinamidase
MINNVTDCLIVTDVQNDFCAGGALEVPDGDAVVGIINSLAQKFEHCLLTQDWHPPGHSSFASSHAGKSPFELVTMDYGPQVLWPDHCVEGSHGADFHDDLHIDRAEMIIRKGFDPDIDSYSAFFENDQSTPTGLTGYLRTREFSKVYLTGLATDFCVAYSALDARKEGFEVYLVEDACRAIDMEGSLAAALQKMDAAGVTRILSSDL